MPEDSIERTIGRLEAEAMASQAQRAELSVKVSELREDMHRNFGELRDLLMPLTKLPEQLAVQDQRIDALRAKQDRQSGALWAAGAFGGLIAGGLAVLVRLADVMKWIGRSS